MSGQTNVARWKIDPSHSLVEFAVRHLMIATVKGRFGKLDGVIEADPDDLSTLKARVEIDAASIDTRDEQRDGHLRSADFFDVENHPTLTFESRSVEPEGDGRFKLIGDLTIRGVTRPVSLDATFNGRGKDPWGGERIAFEADTTVDRRDFNLTWNTALETGGVLVGDQVKIHIEVEAVREG